jgi:hypothetical protein
MEILAEWKAGIKADREWKAEMRAKLDAHQERMEADMKVRREEIMACQETTETCLECKGPIAEDMKSEAEHREVPKEHAAVETGRVPNKRHRGRNLAAEGRSAVQKRHGATYTLLEKIGPGTWYEEP